MDPLTFFYLIRIQNINASTPFPLLGIHSLSYRQNTGPDRDSSVDLNVVWYAELIEEIISGKSILTEYTE